MLNLEIMLCWKAGCSDKLPVRFGEGWAETCTRKSATRRPSTLCLSPPAPPVPSTYRGSLDRKIFRCRYLPRIHSPPEYRSELVEQPDAHFALVETRSCVVRTPPQIAASTLVPWLVGEIDPTHQEHPKQTTSSSQSLSGFVTILHPNHPLCGQQVEVIRMRRGADPDLIVRLPDGLHAAIVMSWTDYALPSDCLSPPTPTHLLDFPGLRQAIQFIEHIRQQENFANHSEE